MSDPRKWLDDEDLKPAERELLNAGKGIDLEDKEKDRIWGSIAGRLPPGPGGEGGGSEGAGGNGSGSDGSFGPTAAVGGGATAVLGAVKMGGLAITGVVAIVLGASSLSSRESREVPTARYASAASAEPASAAATSSNADTKDTTDAVPSLDTPSTASAVPSSLQAPTRPGAGSVSRPNSPADLADLPAASAVPAATIVPTADPPSQSPIPSASASAPVPTLATKLAGELAMVRRAREVLNGGDAARALSLLDETQREFPGGVLGEEREVLTIQALSRVGRTAEAKSRARSFVGTHPKSAHVDAMRALAEH